MQVYGYTEQTRLSGGTIANSPRFQNDLDLHNFLMRHSKLPKDFKMLQTGEVITKGKEHSYVSSAFGGVFSQCGLVIFEKWAIYGEIDKEIFKQHFKTIEHIARECLGYSKAMITHIRGNIVLETAQENGYDVVDVFHNRRSGNKVAILLKDL